MKTVKGKEIRRDVAIPTDAFLILSYPGIWKRSHSTQEAKVTQIVTRFLPKVGRAENKQRKLCQTELITRFARRSKDVLFMRL